MKYNKINSLEVATLVYFIIRSMSLGISISSYIKIGGQTGYLSPLIGMIIGFIPLIIILKILDYKPKYNIIEKIDKSFKCGLIINTILLLIVYLLIIISFWNLINFISTQYLYRTSNLRIALFFSFAFIYITSKKINVLCRVSNILIYISIFISLFCIIGLISDFNFNNLLPFKNIEYPFISGLSHISYSILPIFIILIIPKDNINNKKKLNKFIIIAYIVSNISKILVILITYLVLGYELSNLYEFPDFLVLRRISTNGFFQVFESILATQWIFDIFIFISLLLFYIKYFYNHYINKYTNYFMSINIVIISYLVSNIIFYNNLSGKYFIIYKLPFILSIIFIMLLLIYYKIKKT